MDELTYHTTGLAKSLEASSRAKAKDKVSDSRSKSSCWAPLVLAFRMPNLLTTR